METLVNPQLAGAWRMATIFVIFSVSATTLLFTWLGRPARQRLPGSGQPQRVTRMVLSALGATIALVALPITMAVLIDWQWGTGLDGRDVVWYAVLGAEMLSAVVVLRPRGSGLRFCLPLLAVFHTIGALAFSIYLVYIRDRRSEAGRSSAASGAR